MTDKKYQPISHAELIAFAEIKATLAYLKWCKGHMDQHPEGAGEIAKLCVESLPSILQQSSDASAGHEERLSYWAKRLGIDKKE